MKQVSQFRRLVSDLSFTTRTKYHILQVHTVVYRCRSSADRFKNVITHVTLFVSEIFYCSNDIIPLLRIHLYRLLLCELFPALLEWNKLQKILDILIYL